MQTLSISPLGMWTIPIARAVVDICNKSLVLLWFAVKSMAMPLGYRDCACRRNSITRSSVSCTLRCIHAPSFWNRWNTLLCALSYAGICYIKSLKYIVYQELCLDVNLFVLKREPGKFMTLLCVMLDLNWIHPSFSTWPASPLNRHRSSLSLCCEFLAAANFWSSYVIMNSLHVFRTPWLELERQSQVLVCGLLTALHVCLYVLLESIIFPASN